MTNPKEEESYPMYEDNAYDGDNYYDDANIMYELVSQFIETLNGNETKEELMKMIDDAVQEIHETAILMQPEYIKEYIIDSLHDSTLNLSIKK